MIVPSIDILDGRAVQLRGNKYPKLDVGDPEALADKLGVAGEIAIVDLNAALGKGDNKALIKRILSMHECRVGGGIRNKDIALEYLDAGARRIMVGTMATPEFLSQFPASRLIAALDIKHDKIMVEGWTRQTEDTLEARIKELSPYVSGFLVTFIDREGVMSGLDMEKAKKLIEIAKGKRITFAGGVPGGAQGVAEIASLDAMGADVQAGTALATGELELAQAFSAPLKSDRPDGLWLTLVCDEAGRLLGHAYSDLESLSLAFGRRIGVYHSRPRGLWIKGASSGDTQELLRAQLDCDRDCIRFIVKQNGKGFCHLGRRNCFDDGYGIEKLSRTIAARKRTAPEGSYTKRLFTDPELLASKLREEADELAKAKTAQEAVLEAADVIYFALVKTVKEGGSLADIEAELERRSYKVQRRPGNAKPGYSEKEEGEQWWGIH